MREYPIFVPFGDERLAAVVTVPDEDPRALVMLLQGLGAPRSHRFRVWTRTARALARGGFASVRMDYPQIGDSTGSMTASMKEPPVRESLAVAKVAMKAVGVKTCAAVGNCMGGMTALLASQELEDCQAVGVVVSGDLWKHFVEERDRPKLTAVVTRFYLRLRKRLASRVSSAAREKLVTVAHGKPGSAKRQRRRRRRWTPTFRMRWIPEMRQGAAGSSLLLLYIGPDEVGNRLARAARRLTGRSLSSNRVAQVTVVRADRLDWLHVMPLQQQVVDTLASWLDRTMQDPVGDGLGSTARSAIREPAS